jgi:sec-independent protein translocase protein TatB
MNILGVGPGELLVIFVIALVVAGPKRMIQWAYHIGRYTARIRAMAQETMSAFQKELAASGLDVTKDLASLQATKFDVMKEVSKIVDPALTLPPLEPPEQAQPAASAPAAAPQPVAPASPVEPASPSATLAEPKTDGETEARNDDQTPRYGPWTPS